MDGHRPDRYAVASSDSHPYARPPRRSSDAPSPIHHPHTSPNQYPPRGFPGRPFDSPPRYPPAGGGGGGPGGPGFRPMGGGGGGGGRGRFPPSEYEVPISRHAPPAPPSLSGQKREFPFRESPDHFDGSNFDRKNFNGGSFERKEFDRGSFEGTNVVGGSFDGKDFDGRSFDRNNFEGGNYEKRSFDRGSYDKNSLNGAHLEKISFDGGSYDSNYLNGAHLEKKSFDGGSLEKKSFDGGSFAKLFVGSVPKTATEEDIRPLFEEHGNVVEVALIKDKRTGQQQGCCFIKYATSEEADRAIRGLHNQCTLPGGVGPIQVRYADGERERLGAVEYKLFVGSLNKQATEKDVEEIFIPYGRVEDVYLMRDELKQSRGCGFVKFYSRDMAMAAINALNGIYTMPGCGQPLIVRFADPKRPRPGETRNVPTSGGPGFDPQFQQLGLRPPPNLMEPMRGPVPSNAWNPMIPQNISPSPGVGVHGFGSQMLPRSDDKTTPVNQVSLSGRQFKRNSSPGMEGVGRPLWAEFYYPGGTFGGANDGSLPGHTVASSAQQSFNQPLPQVPYVGQQVSPLLKTNQSPQELPSSLQPQILASHSQGQPSSTSIRPLGQPSFGQGYPSQQMLGFGGQIPVCHPQVQPGVSLATTQPPLTSNLSPHVLSAMASQHQLAGQQQQFQPPLQSPSPLAQMLSQQTQTLKASYQSSQQAFSQLQQQLQLMQPSNQSLTGQQSVPASKQQSPWPGTTPQTAAMPSTAKPVTDALPVTSTASVWTEHTSPDGYKYYYNSKTGESKWEKPEEMKLSEQQPPQQQLQQQPSQQQMQQHPSQQQLQQQPPQLQQQPQQQNALAQQPQSQSRPQGSAAQQFQQTSQLQLQNQQAAQLRHQHPLQHVAQSSSARGAPFHQNIQEYAYSQLPAAANSVSDPARYQQAPSQAAQEWIWKNKPSG